MKLTRTIAWRGRFDTTSNWAVVGTGSLIAYAVQQPEWANLTFVLNLFVLGFFSTNEKRDGSFRKLTVKIKKPGYTPRARSGYYAPKG